MAYRVGIHEQKNSPPVFNALVFETEHEARNYGRDLESRWFGFDHFTVEEIDKPATHVFIIGNLGNTILSLGGN